MRKFDFAVGMAVLALLCGCGRSPEAMGKAFAEKLSAEQLFEVTMQEQIMAAPNVGSFHAQKYEEFCNRCHVPLKKPFLELLRKGFPDVKTNVAHKVLEKSDDPTKRDTVVYKVEYRIDASDRKPVSFFCLFEFVIVSSHDGTVVIKAGGFYELDGKRTNFENPAQVIQHIGLIGSIGVDKMLENVATNRKAGNSAADK